MSGKPTWPALRLLTAGRDVAVDDRVTLDEAGLVVLAADHPSNAEQLSGKALTAGTRGSLVEVLFDTQAEAPE